MGLENALPSIDVTDDHPTQENDGHPNQEDINEPRSRYSRPLLLTEQQVAKILNVSVATLRNGRRIKQRCRYPLPRHYKIGHSVRYKAVEVLGFVEELGNGQDS